MLNNPRTVSAARGARCAGLCSVLRQSHKSRLRTQAGPRFTKCFFSFLAHVAELFFSVYGCRIPGVFCSLRLFCGCGCGCAYPGGLGSVSTRLNYHPCASQCKRDRDAGCQARQRCVAARGRTRSKSHRRKIALRCKLGQKQRCSCSPQNRLTKVTFWTIRSTWSQQTKALAVLFVEYE